MNLVIDQGNSLCKIAVFDNNQLLELFKEENLLSDFLYHVLSRFSIEGCIFSSVRKEDEKILSLLKNNVSNFIQFDQQTKVPIEIAYKTPATLGRDRIAAVVGARCIFPQKDVLVIDAGTCVTYELLTKSGVYLGGNISAGFSTRLRAMRQFTGKLPLLTPEVVCQKMGTDTNSAMLVGTYRGLLSEIEGFIQDSKQILKNDNICIIATGGEAHFFVNKLKDTIFVDENLVLVGLNTILNHNAS
ncbi:MAG: type III pantothenate kinase [Paludibacteraceae bacterium]|nr:type III pantothenate kinase [Paludibacteraceae bacterium]